MAEQSSRPIVEEVVAALNRIRQDHPLVHNITNFVVMNFTANALLALGASPVMAHAPEEVEEMVGLAGALVVNIGTLSSAWVDSMLKAANAALDRSVPVVLDPVGAGATRFRTDSARRILDSARVAVVRGNASEILALAGNKGTTKGVDSVLGSSEAKQAASELAKKYETIVAVTGAEDFVTNGYREAHIGNGHPLMGRITGTGCAASSITGAFCAVSKDPFAAAIGALVAFGIAGELAAQSNPGPGSFQPLLLDALDSIDPAAIRKMARISI